MTLPPIHSEQVYALVVGIEQYQAGSDYDLNGPANDALQFATWLLDQGVQPDHIRLFLSPLERNRSVNEIAVAKGLKPEPATRGHVDSTIRSEFTSENGRGDLLYVFWGGHGTVTGTDGTKRRLLFADTDDQNKWNLNVNSLVDALRTAAHGSGFPQQIFVFDACANPIYQEGWQTTQVKAAGSSFAASGQNSVHMQWVLFASSEYEVAINDSELGTGRFSQAVLDELKDQPLLPELPEMEALIKRTQVDFLMKQKSQPAYWLRIGNDDIIQPAVKGDRSGQENLPRVNPVFVGREEALEALHLQLKADVPMAISSIQGMGGIGKTELALQYAWKHLAAKDYPGGVCWLRSRKDIGVQIVEFARSRLGLEIPTDVELAERVRICWRDWQKNNALIVFDDVQTYKEIKEFLPPQGKQFRVLLTTRKYLDGSVQTYEIKVLSEAASLEMLRRLVPDGRIDRELERSEKLCKWLGYLPLGLELVGRYLARKKGLSIEKLWGRLQEQRLAARALLKAEPGMTATLGVTAAFELSWQELDAEARRLAGLLSLFALAEIPWELVQQCLPEADEEGLEDLRDEQLVNLSLLSSEGEEMYQLHQLVKEFFAVKREQRADDSDLQQRFYQVMIAEAEKVTEKPEKSLIQESTIVIAHLQGTMERLARPEQVLDLATCLNWVARLYYVQGRYGEAEPLYVRSLLIREQHLGTDHPDVAYSLDRLASLYHLQGRYGEAEPLYVRSLSIWEQQLGTDHPDVANSLNNLALLYNSQGRYGEAEPLYVRSFSISEQQLGTDHPDVANSLNNLALLYNSQGRYGEAEPFYVRSLSIWEQQLGADHPEVAASLNNLAFLYNSQGRYGEAEPLYVRSLSIREQQLGTDHPDVATSLSNLAALYNSQGRYGEAEPLYVRSLSIREQQLGTDHPDVVYSLNGLATLYRSQGRYDGAEPFLLRSVRILQEQLPADHPLSARIVSNLAYLYDLQGRYREAEALYLQALPILSAKLEESHQWRQEASQRFRSLLQKAIQEHRTDELLDDPMTRSLLQELRNSLD